MNARQVKVNEFEVSFQAGDYLVVVYLPGPVEIKVYNTNGKEVSDDHVKDFTFHGSTIAQLRSLYGC